MNTLMELWKRPIKISEHITLNHPTLGEIIDYGEDKYFSLITMLTASPSDMKSTLFDSGIDYEEVSDFDLFVALTKDLEPAQSGILLGDTNLSKLKCLEDPHTKEPVLCERLEDDKHVLVMDSVIYKLLVSKIRNIHQMKHNVEKAYNQYTKKVLIDEDRERKRLKKEFTSILEPLIVSMVCCSDFPYDYNSILSVPIGTFLRSVTQVQKKDSVKNIMTGIYSGGIDASKIEKSSMSWI